MKITDRLTKDQLKEIRTNAKWIIIPGEGYYENNTREEEILYESTNLRE